MAADDFAVVIGINSYPGLGNLKGAHLDADAFRRWLMAPDGGGLPEDHITLILAPSPQPLNPWEAKPDENAIVSALEQERARGVASGRSGRRLYVYMAGHGFAPDLRSACLLTANATDKSTTHHIPGPSFLDWFVESRRFDEVLLFMDCCREIRQWGPIQPRPWDPEPAETRGTYCYGFATDWALAARELPWGQEGIRGLFTVGLISGLSGGAEVTGQGEITAGALEDYIQQFVDAHADPTVPQRPRFLSDKRGLVLASGVKPLTRSVRISRKDGGDPKDIQLLKDGATLGAGPQPGLWDVPSGLYKAVTPAGSKQIEVLAYLGSEEVVENV